MADILKQYLFNKLRLEKIENSAYHKEYECLLQESQHHRIEKIEDVKLPQDGGLTKREKRRLKLWSQMLERLDLKLDSELEERLRSKI